MLDLSTDEVRVYVCVEVCVGVRRRRNYKMQKGSARVLSRIDFCIVPPSPTPPPLESFIAHRMHVCVLAVVAVASVH